MIEMRRNRATHKGKGRGEKINRRKTRNIEQNDSNGKDLLRHTHTHTQRFIVHTQERKYEHTAHGAP